MTDTQNAPVSNTPRTEWLTIRQVALELQVHTNTAYQMVKSGELEAFRYNARVIRVPRSALETLLTRYKGGEFGLWASK
jgi:excisionase family DNA binding protein